MSRYHYTVHPFDDEWTWDQSTNGELPCVFGSLEEAVTHAVQVKIDYTTQFDSDESDSDWARTFWSAIYDNIGDQSDYDWRHPEMYDGGDSALMGYVDPDGIFHKCFDKNKIPLDELGGFLLKGENHV